MISMILETLFSVALFISGGHLVSTNFKLHHYSDDDYKDIFFWNTISQLVNIVKNIQN